MATVYCRDNAGIAHAIATVSWDTNLKVTINVTYNESNSWRVKKQGVYGDNYEVQRTDGGTTGSFQAVNGQTYVFQSIINGKWTNSLDDSGNFTVGSSSSGGDSGDDDDDDGGSSSSGGSSFSKKYLHISQGKGTVVQVERVSSSYYGYSNGSYEVVHGSSIYWPGDVLRITAYAEDGYEINYYTDSNGNVFPFEFTGLDYNKNTGLFSSRNATPIITITAKRISGEDEIKPVISQDVATIVGQKGRASETSGSFNSNNSTYNNNDCYYARYLYESKYNENLREVAIIKFIAPKFDGVSTSIDVGLYIRSLGGTFIDLNITLCTSDEYYSMYFSDGSDNWIPNDPTKIATTTVVVTDVDVGERLWAKIPTNLIKSEQEYYLIAWLPKKVNGKDRNVGFDPATYHRIYVNYTTQNVVYICDDGQKYNPYHCYISTLYPVYSSYDCEIIGQRCHNGYIDYEGIKGIYSFANDPTHGYSYESESMWGSEYNSFTLMTHYYAYHLKFRTPSDSIVGDISVIFNIKMIGAENNNSKKTMNYSLDMSSDSFDDYGNELFPSDESYSSYAYGTFESTLGSGTNTIKMNIAAFYPEEEIMPPNTEFVLNIWCAEEDCPLVYVDGANNHSVTIAKESEENIIGYKNEFELYEPYIDNGTTWEPL